MKKLLFPSVAAIALMAWTGCDIRVSNGSGSGWSFSSLKASTNILTHGEIAAGVKTLDVVNAFGALHITGSDTDAPGWTQNLTVCARTAATVREIATDFVCKAEVDGDRLRLVVTPPDSLKSHEFQSDLEITVPKSVAVIAHNRYGKTDIHGLNRDIEATSQFGTMDVHDINGNVRAETSYAALKVNNTGPATLKDQFGAIEAADIHGALEAGTSYGTLDAHDIGGSAKLRNQFGRLNIDKADEADAKTSYGEMRVNDIKGDANLVNQFGRVSANDITGSVKAVTSYGPMDIKGPGKNFVCNNEFGEISVQATSMALANLEARTSYGTLNVRLPSSLKPAVQAHTTYGSVESDFQVILKSESDVSSAAGEPGAPSVNLRNQNGKIRVIKE